VLFVLYRRNITCLQQTTNTNFYLSTTNNKKELLAVHNPQQRGNITCLKQITHKELLPVCNKQQRNNFYLSTTRNKEELLPVYYTQQRVVDS
jgi:hypothetical protein